MPGQQEDYAVRFRCKLAVVAVSDETKSAPLRRGDCHVIFSD